MLGLDSVLGLETRTQNPDSVETFDWSELTEQVKKIKHARIKMVGGDGGRPVLFVFDDQLSQDTFPTIKKLLKDTSSDSR